MTPCARAMRSVSVPEPFLNVASYSGTDYDRTSPPDDVLVEAVKMGETAAFARLIARYQRLCLARAHSILRNQSDAEDEVQAAWVQAWTHLGSYEGQGSFFAWLNRIVSNQCLMRLRKAKQMPVISVDEVFGCESSFRLEILDQRALPEELVGNDQVSHVLRKEVYALPRLLRDVLVMRDLLQMSLCDIAAHLEITVPAAKSRLMRARVELKQRLSKHHGKRGSGTLIDNTYRRGTAFVSARAADLH